MQQPRVTDHGRPSLGLGTPKTDDDDSLGLNTTMCGFLILALLHFCENLQAFDLVDLPEHIQLSDWRCQVTVGCVRIYCTANRFSARGPATLDETPEGINRVHTQDPDPSRVLRLLPAGFPVHRSVHPNRGWAQDLTKPTGLLDGLDLALLTRLDLIHCIMTEERLCTTRSRCTNLAGLTYISLAHHEALGGHEDNSAARAHGITNVLNRRSSPGLRKTLRRLVLEHFSGQDGSYCNSYTSFRNLESLEDVYLGANGLFCLPTEALKLCPAWDGSPPPDPTPLARMPPLSIVRLNILQAATWEDRVRDAVLTLLDVLDADRWLFRNLEDKIWNMSGHEYPQESLAILAAKRTDNKHVWAPRLAALASAVGVKFSTQPKPAPPVIGRLRDTHTCMAFGTEFPSS